MFAKRLSIIKKIGFIAGLSTVSYFSVCQYSDYSAIGAIRFGRAAIAVFRVVLDYKWNLQGITIDSIQYNQTISKIHLRSAELLKDVCCRNGGCFIKVGQHVGCLEYLLPFEYVNTMKTLYADAPQSSLKEIYKVIKEDFGKDANEIFVKFDPVPLGAASLAQVHRAELTDGCQVAVKVQHPNVARHSQYDLMTMEVLVNLVAWLFPEFSFRWLAEEAKKNLPRELDFQQEGCNAERAARRFEHLSFIHIPKIYWNLSSSRVLTMEYCSGTPINDVTTLAKRSLSPLDVSRKLGKLYSEMIFEQGFVHCDPHPGNLLVDKAPNGKALIVLLDHGLYTQLSDDFRLSYCRLWQALLSADVAAIQKASEELGCSKLHGILACMVSGRSWSAVKSGIDRHDLDASESVVIQTEASNYIPQIITTLNSVPRAMLLLLKTNDLIRGIESSLGTRGQAAAFLAMSRNCVRALARHRSSYAATWTSRLLCETHLRLQLFRITLCEITLLLYDAYKRFSSPLLILRHKFLL